MPCPRNIGQKNPPHAALRAKGKNKQPREKRISYKKYRKGSIQKSYTPLLFLYHREAFLTLPHYIYSGRQYRDIQLHSFLA